MQVSDIGDPARTDCLALAVWGPNLSPRGRLPAAARHACGITAGDRVLRAAEAADGVLVVHPLAALDEMVTGLHDRVIDGEA